MKKINFKDIILFEDDNYIVVNKPPYISTLEDRTSPINILDIAREYNPEIQICHRLDKETSGALVIAKNSQAYRNIAMQFEARTVQKVYHAVVDGIHNLEPVKVSAPILLLGKGKVAVSFGKGKPSETLVRTSQTYKRHTLVECKPLTGRMHQIRIHMKYLGAPLAGDETYGGQKILLSQLKKRFNLTKGLEEKPLCERVALHAYSIEFKNMDESAIFIEAPYPKDFDVLIKQLEKNSR